jgi:hypothetical protein
MAKRMFTTQRPMLPQRHNLAAMRGHDVAGAPLRTANNGLGDTLLASVASAPADGALRALEVEARRRFEVTRQTGGALLVLAC